MKPSRAAVVALVLSAPLIPEPAAAGIAGDGAHSTQEPSEYHTKLFCSLPEFRTERQLTTRV